ncbi:response regulator [Fodinibius halophilus]|uniref:Response regulator n=1 Tax=Fodinibius halophilus TaxID=1736908 RepID=A0A6M1T771_9BACT|nr:response regulator [Fodinibius halophilus]NGP87841.1 response regulator [Fodinibius halophilus]
METKKVLIVEDELIISMLIERMVGNMGHEVVDKVSSGEDAITAAFEHEPDIILMDIRLQGDINGIEAMSQIREKLDTPVIYISGNTDKLHMDQIESSDYIEFLSKPITFSELNRSFDMAS